MNSKLSLRFFLLLCFIYLSLDLVAQTRYVDVNIGLDNIACGTIGSPCKTIQYTVDYIALNNDVVYLKSGIYSLPFGANLDSAVVELPANRSLHFVGDSLGAGAIINGTNNRRGFHYEHSVNCPLSGGANNIRETRKFSFDKFTSTQGRSFCFFSLKYTVKNI